MKEDESDGIGQRFARVSAVSGVSTALSVGLQLVSVPVCLHYWGNDTYGQWLALFAAFTILRTLDGGYIGYVGNKLNILYHRDQVAMRLAMASAVYGALILGVVQIAVLIVLYATGSMEIILSADHGSMESTHAFLAISILSLSWILTGSYLGVVHRFLIPAGLMYQSAWWAMGFQVAQFAALMLSAVLGFTLLEAALLFGLCQAAIYLASAVYIKYRLPEFYPWWQGPNALVGVGDLIKSMPFIMSGILQQGGISGIIVAISSVLGPAAVPAFATVRTLSNLWTMLITVFTAPLLPEVVRFHAKFEKSKLAAIQKAHWLLMSVVVNLSIMLAYPSVSWFYGLWTRHQVPLDHSLLCLLFAVLPLTGMSALINVYLTGINRFSFVFSFAMLRGIGALTLGILLMPFFGLTGIGASILVAELLALVVSLRLFIGEMAKPDRERKLISLSGWHWMSPAAVFSYFVLESTRPTISVSAYCAFLMLTLVGSALSWRDLEWQTKVDAIAVAKRYLIRAN